MELQLLSKLVPYHKTEPYNPYRAIINQSVYLEYEDVHQDVEKSGNSKLITMPQREELIFIIIYRQLSRQKDREADRQSHSARTRTEQHKQINKYFEIPFRYP